MNKVPSTGLQVFLGFLLGVGLNLFMMAAGFLLALFLVHGSNSAETRLQGLVVTGIVQPAWQVPVVLLLRRAGHKTLALGVILACSIFVLLNAICWATANMRVGG